MSTAEPIFLLLDRAQAGDSAPAWRAAEARHLAGVASRAPALFACVPAHALLAIAL
jgi:hypothetical protein